MALVESGLVPMLGPTLQPAPLQLPTPDGRPHNRNAPLAAAAPGAAARCKPGLPGAAVIALSTGAPAEALGITVTPPPPPPPAALATAGSGRLSRHVSFAAAPSPSLALPPTLVVPGAGGGADGTHDSRKPDTEGPGPSLGPARTLRQPSSPLPQGPLTAVGGPTGAQGPDGTDQGGWAGAAGGGPAVAVAVTAPSGGLGQLQPWQQRLQVSTPTTAQQPQLLSPAVGAGGAGVAGGGYVRQERSPRLSLSVSLSSRLLGTEPERDRNAVYAVRWRLQLQPPPAPVPAPAAAVRQQQQQ